MTIEQRANHAAVQRSSKSFVFFLRLPFGYDFAVLRKAANVQTFGVRRSATPARTVWGVLFLK